MAKRNNPYTEDYVPQSKIHVGIKQFNNNEDRLKKVYEKTLELLFKGAKKPVPESTDNLNTATVTRDKMKQLFIGKNGTLLHSGTVLPTVTLHQCACGQKFDLSCSYCEKALCTTCRLHCTSCDSYYCSQCSVIGSEGSAVCVSCYS